MSSVFPDHPGYPNGWYDEGPFGIWKHPDGGLIVAVDNVNSVGIRYVLTIPAGREARSPGKHDTFEFDVLEDCMESWPCS